MSTTANDENLKKVPSRKDVDPGDTWDLSSLYGDDAEWDAGLAEYESQIEGYAAFRGRLSESAELLAEMLEFDSQLDRIGERLGTYAFLRTTEDQGDSGPQRMYGRFQSVSARAAEAASYIRPELIAIAEERMDELLAAAPLAPWRLALERVLRFKPHTLDAGQEQLLAMQGEMSQSARHAFEQLFNADLKFGNVADERGRQVELSNATFVELLQSPSREVRRKAFLQYYDQFDRHRNTFAATLNGSVQTDVYYARARGYDSARGAALFSDNVPLAVYDSLLEAVRSSLPKVHHYYDVRRRKMGLDDLHHYDTYVPILSDLEVERPWDQAVSVILESLTPLGSEYCGTLEEGLRGRWCDRYPNQGKHSGAFSCGSFDGAPYILMNYKPTVFDDVFTLAHEAGHSMHSSYSAESQPFQYHKYVIFVAEVASTFNEQLLGRHLMAQARDDRERAYLINHELDGIRATIIRQTMFAEFEKVIHEMVEGGEPLTVQALQDAYRGLLLAYFGDQFVIDDQLSLECLRIPHFYRAFYVYKYATGLSAAIALSDRVLTGGDAELQAYLGFLRSGCSQFPLDLLRDAGVDMESPQPVQTALERFGQLVDELDRLL